MILLLYDILLNKFNVILNKVKVKQM